MKTIIKVVLISLVAFSVFTTCNSPMGMGDQIDFEPPVLTMDPVPNPYYVREGSMLSGTVTDNDVVARVIFINTATGKELFPVKREGDNWSIDLEFTADQNGEKIVGQIIAYDRAGNSGEPSIAFVTMIVDIRPPIVENITIQRTDTRIARLEPLRTLKNFETTDPKGEKKDDLYKYQNGWFTITGVVNDEETKIEIISLDIYDVREIDYKLLSLPVDAGYTNYFPRWTVKEEDIINAGEKKWENYKTDYYDNGERYYYRVVIKAVDMSNNQNISNITVEEDEGYICLWEKSDVPKGILDPVLGTIVSRGTPLPIDFYDDDSLDWAYAGLLTYEQWQGLNAVYTGDVMIPSTYSDDQKLEWLKDRLREGKTVYNWRFDSDRSHKDTSKDAIIAEQIEGKKLDEKLVYIPTGNIEEDYGEFVLFTLMADNKLAPHDKNGPESTNKNRWAGRVLRIQVIDENAPLIVFDTAKIDEFENPKLLFCPEENTFPTPLINGAEFNIVGYTLRENASGNNSVLKFRMAWIPYNMPDNADKWIPAVQKALTSSTFAGMPDGVQYWEFVEGAAPGSGKGNFKNEGTENIDTSIYKKQSFIKKFNVLGGPDDLKSDTNNFYYNDKLENETKLFIFYAEDNMGHQVFRQLRLLGMKTPPDLSIYDISNKYANELLPNGIPDPNIAENINIGTGIPTDEYYASLRTFNNTVYDRLKTVTVDQDDKTVPFQIYPRGTIVKYWVNASKTGDIAVKTISMKDITFDVGKDVFLGSDYNVTDGALSYCEYFPDVTQRTFLFEAEDKLGNIARVQRTIAITNAARLENITTTTQNGTYGINTPIVITANFSSQIYLEGGRPYLNVRYKIKGRTENSGYFYERIRSDNEPTYENPSLSLNFTFNIRDNYTGQLESTFENMLYDTPSQDYSRPIMPYNARIMDYIRMDPAFIPGIKNELITMPNWQTDANTLQKKKTIMLDGIRPNISGVTMGGKAPYADNDYYFKNGESIELTLTADKPVKISTNIGFQSLKFKIKDSGGTEHTYDLLFKYQRPGPDPDGHMLVFSLPVNDKIPYDGTLTSVSLYSANVIQDDFGNLVIESFPPAPPEGSNFYFKQTIPPAPAAKLNNVSYAAAPTYYASSPTLEIPGSSSPAFADWEDVKQYSLDGGMTWNTYSTPVSIPGGTHRLRARYVDRAGNEGTPTAEKEIQVNSTFPALVSVNAEQGNGWYVANSNLTFNLNFADTVTVNDASNVKITLENRNTGNTANNTIDLTARTDTNVTTVKFNWTGISGKEMRDGLYISAVNLSGLKDKFGNTGPTGGTASWDGSAPTNISINSCPNLAAGIKVDAIAPTIDTTLTDKGRVPMHDTAPSGNDSITEIKLKFREPVMKGSGIITIRPRGNYAIPPVLRDTGYYLGTDGNEYLNVTDAPTVKKTYISSFYDIYNALTSATDRNALSQSTSSTPSMSTLRLNDRTGQSYGPYKKMTHGLVEGFGYSGAYSGSDVPNANVYTAMIPDTATKWVLDYQYSITGSNAEVTAIRTALTNAKWRWQEIDVVSTDIVSNIVTITLTEPLLKGLEWDVYYPAGAFTDMAGNPAPASGNYLNGATTGTNTDYYFVSPGVQPPVIRVDRRSYDGKNSNWASNTNRTYNAPPNTGGTWNTNAAVVSDKGLDTDTGWGILDFNYVHYRVETESSAVTGGASVSAQTFKGETGNQGGITADWSNNVPTTTTPWTETSNANGTWVLPNLLRRAAAQNGSMSYTVVSKNGVPELRTAQLNNAALRMFKSYNRDLNMTQLNGGGGVTLGSADFDISNGQGVITFSSLEASKSYVVGTATCNLQTAKGYEGVFRTVIVFNYTNNREASNFFQVQGSNIKNGMPSVAGFPVRDAEETGDNRFTKVFCAPAVANSSDINDDTGATALRSYYWVSTEIVCEWYFLNWGGGNTDGATATKRNGTHQNCGEVNNYLMVGYGDLTYGFNISNSNMVGLNTEP